MSPFTLTLIKLAFLAVLWLFVIAAVGVIRADLFGSKAATRAATRASQPRPPRAARQPKPPRSQRAAHRALRRSWWSSRASGPAPS